MKGFPVPPNTLGGWNRECVNLYLPTRTPEEERSSHLQSSGWQPIFYVWLDVWSDDFASTEKEHYHTWHCMSLLRPSIIKQHKNHTQTPYTRGVRNGTVRWICRDIWNTHSHLLTCVERKKEHTLLVSVLYELHHCFLIYSNLHISSRSTTMSSRAVCISHAWLWTICVWWLRTSAIGSLVGLQRISRPGSASFWPGSWISLDWQVSGENN